ncbi:uncharacterized protein LOC124916728 [Impatiens glandulifera]|uniref:uncharacterized protein LOC124916728 n=1 Tax=Impatiens glandulifera TaxID=253017 RepID=UPI001FB0ACFC|nr:uncharacterized protein LOC124916728 [Impatiens glandulifera]
MPAVWFSLRKSLHCRSGPSDVHEPKVNNNGGNSLSNILTKKSGWSGCSRSISNLKDVIHGGSKRYMEKAPSCSPRSIGSSDFLNPITHEVVFNNSACEIKITTLIGTQEGAVGTVKPGTPGPRRRSVSGLDAMIPPRPRASFGKDWPPSPVFSSSLLQHCHKCGEKFAKWEDVESHHLSKHAVTELIEGDSSRKIVEMICRTGWIKSAQSCGQMERILKVHNMQNTIAQFEEYRETVKIKASKLQKKHPRCLADGNELLRFYGTTMECSLGENGSSSICVSEECNVCQILKNGFRSKKESGGFSGVFTTSTSGRALEIRNNEKRKALVVCRVIAGRVHRPLENDNEMVGQIGFDSVAGKMGVYSNIEELYLLSTKALLPCFVVIFKP